MAAGVDETAEELLARLTLEHGPGIAAVVAAELAAPVHRRPNPPPMRAGAKPRPRAAPSGIPRQGGGNRRAEATTREARLEQTAADPPIRPLRHGQRRRPPAP